MKARLFLLLSVCAAFCVLSCTQEIEGNGLDSRQQVPTSQEMSRQEVILSAYVADSEPATKTSIAFDSGNSGSWRTMWSTNESISLFYGSGTGGGECFTSTNTSPAERVQFRGNISVITGLTENSDDIRFWGIYPYNQSNSCDGGSVTTVINSTQLGKANTWEDGQFVSVGRSYGLSMGFYNVCSALRFYFERDDIKAISFRGRNSEDIAGVVKVVFNSSNVPVIQEFVAGEKEITLSAPDNGTFTASTSSNPVYYYLVVPPMTFTQGFVCTLYTESQYGSRTMTSSFTFERSKYHNGGAIDHNVTFTARPLESNQIRYTATESVDYYIPNGSNTGNVVVSNNWDSSTGEGLITFAAPITAVDNEAFCDAWALTSVTLPDGVLSIGREAFAYCEALTTVNLPNSVTDIYGLAFAHCTSLQSIHIPKLLGIGYPNPFSGCTNLCSFTGPDASSDGKFLGFSWDDPTNTRLYSCALGAFKNQELILPQVIKIGAEAFAGGEFTGTVTIPKTVTTIENKAFYGCSGVNEIVLEHRSYTNFNSNNIPALPALEEAAFHTAGSAPCSSIKVPGALLVASNARIYQQDDVWYGYRNQVVGYQADNEIWMSEDVQPHGLTVKGSETTSRLLTGMILPMGFDATNYSRFCVSVEPTVPFPSTFTLKPITVMVYNDDIVAVKDKAFNKDNALNSTDIAQVEYISLPHSVEYIGIEAFKDDIALLAFPSDGYNLSEIDDDAFSGCTAMTGTISIFHSEFVNGGIPRCGIGSRVFQGCVGIEDVTLYECAEIGGYAFAGCTSLQRVNLEGGSVDFIADHAFDGCVDLERVAPSAAGVDKGLYGDFVMIRRYAFNNTAIEEVDCRAIALDQFAFSGMNITSASIIGTETYPTSVGKYAFNGCSYLTSVRIPYVDGDLGENVFSGCSSLRSILLGVASIPAEYFKNFTSLKTVRLPQATSLGQSAFQGCTNLQTVEIPLVTTLGDYCFAGQHKVTTLALPSVTTIGTGALGNGTLLNNVTIGPNITSLTNSLFTQYQSGQDKPASFNLVMLKTTPPAISNNTFSNLGLNAAGLPAGTSPLTITLANRLIGQAYHTAWKDYTPFSILLQQGIQPAAIFVLAN